MIIKLIPRKVFLTSGAGAYSKNLEYFKVALLCAGIAKFNNVQNSFQRARKMLSIYAGCAFPENIDKHGYISEDHAYRERAQDVGEHSVELARRVYASGQMRYP